MKVFKRVTCVALLLLAMAFSFNAYAMSQSFDSYEPTTPTPSVDQGYQYGYRWTWLNDNLCVRFQTTSKVTFGEKRDDLDRKYNYGMVTHWYENGQIKTRDAYSGEWNQDEKGTWSFVFDDDTIPIDLTKIDGVLYAFNGYGELMDGYKYWNGQKTGPDGLATCTDPEFITYLGTQYLPDCTSHK